MHDKELNTAIYGFFLGLRTLGQLIQKKHRYVKGFFEEPENNLFRECHSLMRQISRAFIFYPIFLLIVANFSKQRKCSLSTSASGTVLSKIFLN